MGISSCLSSIPRKWKTPKLLIAMFIIELPFSIAALALFGIASPDLYRTRFWQQGFDLGWNSNPNQAIYAAANYKPYSAPLPWSQLFVSLSRTHKICTELSTNQLQHHKLQRRHFRPFSLHTPLQSDRLDYRCSSPAHLAHRPRWTRCALGCQHP